MNPDQKAGRLGLIADEVDGARRLIVAARMALDKSPPNSTDADEADALCELLYEIGDRLKATAARVRAEVPAP